MGNFWCLRKTTHIKSTPSPSSKLSPSSILQFAHLLGNLKTTKRTGWVTYHIHNPESIADHMYRMSILSWIFTDQYNHYQQNNHSSLDQNKIMKMALLHDIIEAICGDVIPIERLSGVSKEEKYKSEHDAILKIKNEYLKGSQVGQEMYDLWIEYEEQQSLESHIVKDLDKLDMIIQAEEYEQMAENKGIDLSGFFKITRNVFKTQIGRQLDLELMEQRKDRLSQ